MVKNNQVNWRKWFESLNDKSKQFLREEAKTSAGAYVDGIVDRVNNALYNAVRCWNQVKFEDPVRMVVCIDRMITELERLEEIVRQAKKELGEVMEFLMAVYDISEEDIEEEILREMEEEEKH